MYSKYHNGPTEEMETRVTGRPATGGGITQSLANQSGGNGQRNATGSDAQVVAGPAHETNDEEYWVVSHGERLGVYRGQ